MLVQPVLIGMVIDAFMLQISVQQVWLGKTIAVRATLQNAQVIHMNLTVNVFHFQQNVHQVLLGTLLMVVLQLPTLAQPVHITMV
jgi:hypothetical protein